MCAEAARLPLKNPDPSELQDPALYLNRELSHLEFQRRVLEEARDRRNPLLERVKFLSIFASNIDEFFMVRVAGVLQQIENGVQETGMDGRGPSETLDAIRASVSRLVNSAYDYFREDLIPALQENHVRLLQLSELSLEQRAQLDTFFVEKVFPVLTPLAFDPGRPFPHISNLSLNVAVAVREPGGGAEHFARVKVPDSLPQLLPVALPPVAPGPAPRAYGFVWLEHLIVANLHHLFPGLEILRAHVFHLTRDAEVAIKELETDDLLETIEEAVWQRRFRDAVRLQVDARMPAAMIDFLASKLELDAANIFRVQGPLDLSRLRHLAALDRPDLKDKPFLTHTPAGFASKEDDVFEIIRQQDQLLHHPYESFQPVVEFLRKAAKDPDVLAIKMTLYRLGRNSPIVEALLEAVENGKQVAVVVELKARFDEESNIEWARALEGEGVHVVYGLLGLKVHCKIALIVRREAEGIRRYLHLGTGNYNATTARLYTDLTLFTSNADLGADATDLFNYLTGYSHKADFRKLLVAPVTLRKRMAALIQREMEHGSHGRLIFKMNALEDRAMVRLLYEASRAGVKIDLIVRGLCCLRPGIPGVSENITVKSIVGRFLEHSRLYYFGNGGKEEIYMGSADLMPRNLDRRVELLFPIHDAAIVRRLRDSVLKKCLADNSKTRLGRSNGTYEFMPVEGAGSVDSQAWFIEHRASAAC